MAITIQHKRDTAANWTSNNPTLASGEFGFETDTGKLKLGDGSTAWSSLGYFEPEAATPSGPSNSPIQGSSCGFVVGGITPSTPTAFSIEKYSFSSDSNATCVGCTLQPYIRRSAGSVSSTHGYSAGGMSAGNVIQKFPFSISSATATDVGDLTDSRGYVSGATSSTHGYAAGGCCPTSPPRGTANGNNRIDKFPFSSDSNATDVGCLLTFRSRFGGSSSPSHGYVTGGYGPNFPQYLEAIEKFSFSSDGNATCVGDLVPGTGGYHSGHSSDSSGYITGGGQWPTICNTIQKYPFSSDSNSTDVADLVACRSFISGQSSTTHGYVVGGYGPGGSCNTIEKFSFPSDANATDVGDLVYARYGGTSDIAT